MEELIVKGLKKACKKGLGLVVLTGMCVAVFSGGNCQAASKDGFITKIKGDKIYCKLLTSKAKKAQDSNVLFYPKKGYVTGTKKYQLTATVKFEDMLEGTTTKKKTGVKKKIKQYMKEYKKGIPVSFVLSGKKCKKISVRVVA